MNDAMKTVQLQYDIVDIYDDNTPENPHLKVRNKSGQVFELSWVTGLVVSDPHTNEKETPNERR